jgi:DNA primase
LRAAAPVVAGIRDQALNIGYVRNLAGWLGMEPREVAQAVTAARGAAPRTQPARDGGRMESGQQGQPESERVQQGPSLVQLPTDPATRLERDAIMVMLQQPAAVGRALVERASQVTFSNPSLAVVKDGIAASMDDFDSPRWLDRVIDEVPGPFSTLVKELGVAPIPEKDNRALAIYCQGVTTDLIGRHLLHQKSEMLGNLQRTDAAAEPARYLEIQKELVRIEAARRALRTEQ